VNSTLAKIPGQTTFKIFQDPFELAMAVYTLVIGVIFHTYAGSAADMTPRLSHLHTLLDAKGVDREGSGVVQVFLNLSSCLATDEYRFSI
jgi:hypothetical protein